MTLPTSIRDSLERRPCASPPACCVASRRRRAASWEGSDHVTTEGESLLKAAISAACESRCLGVDPSLSVRGVSGLEGASSPLRGGGRWPACILPPRLAELACAGGGMAVPSSEEDDTRSMGTAGCSPGALPM
jgi:hypothetical protein